MARNQRGFGALEAVLVVLLIGLIGVIGWYVYRANHDTLTSEDFSDSAVKKSDIPVVNSTDDLESSEEFLNKQNLDEQLDTSEIDSTLE